MVSTICNDKAVLLQTVTISTEGERGHQFVQCLLGGGSQRTPFTTDTARRLNDKTVGEETLKIFGFDEVAKTQEKNTAASGILVKTSSRQTGIAH